MNEELQRLREDRTRIKHWKRWGPYLAERQWATVREDYSEDGNPWNYLPHEFARSRAYRWGEDGLLGITDRECRLCFALALWNGRDPLISGSRFRIAAPNRPRSPFSPPLVPQYLVWGGPDEGFSLKPRIWRNKDGTKVAPVYRMTIAGGDSRVVYLRLVSVSEWDNKPNADPKLFERRKSETDEFYEPRIGGFGEARGNVARQAAAGLLWSKQFYSYIVKDWLTGDRDQPKPPTERCSGRNNDWCMFIAAT
jgi:hypothetical protein